MRQKRATPRRSGRVRDRAYLLAVKGLPCLRAGTTWDPCCGPIEADHAGKRPLGRKADDSTAIPLCQRHHRQRTDGAGWFRRLTAEGMRYWCDTAIAETRARLGYQRAA